MAERTSTGSPTCRFGRQLRTCWWTFGWTFVDILCVVCGVWSRGVYETSTTRTQHKYKHPPTLVCAGWMRSEASTHSSHRLDHPRKCTRYPYYHDHGNLVGCGPGPVKSSQHNRVRT